MQATIAEPPALLSKLTQLHPKLGLIIPPGLVAHALSVGAYDATRPPIAHPQKRLQACDRLSLGSGHH